MKSPLVASCMLFALLLSGCSTLDKLPYFNRSAPAADSNSTTTPATDKLGIAVSQTQPEKLESISFFAKTPFASKIAEYCVEEHLIVADAESNIKYLGLDTLTTYGSISGENRTFGLLIGNHQIAFHLKLIGQHNGTRYGFSELRLANQDKFNITNHDFQPILANSGASKRVYQTLAALFHQLDACISDDQTTQ